MKKRLIRCFLLFSFLLAYLPVRSQVNSSAADWKQIVANAHATEAVVVDHLFIGDCDGMVVNAVGSTVYLRLASTGALWGSYSTGGLIDNKPVLVKLQDGKWYVFVTAEDGKLYKLDVANHGVLATTGGISQIRNCRRTSDSGCLEKDKIDAAPVVQLKAASNSSYTLGADIVMVATHHGCGSSTTNMVYAFDAADITQPPLWVFNEFGDYAVDYCEHFILDTSRNTIFCATNLVNGHFQNTLWSINTVTGNLVWGSNFNSMQGRPVVGNPSLGQFNRLYAADMLGMLHAVNPDNGVEYWNRQLDPTPGVYDNLPLSLGEAGYAGMILTTTSSGKIYAIYDNVDSSEVLWIYNPGGSVKVNTGSAIMSTTGKCYAGLNNGTVQQLNMIFGTSEAYSMPYNSIGAAASSNAAEPGIYKLGLRYKLIQSHWGGPGALICQFNVPDFIQNNNPNLNTWIGGIDSAWENPANWLPNRVPDATTDVLITCAGYGGSSTNSVMISGNAVCRSLDMQGGMITVNPGFNLRVLH